MAYAAVTSLMGTLSQHFLQPQPRLPLPYKQQILSLHQNLGFLQEILEKSEMAYDEAGAMKDVEAEIRDAVFEAEERIEMELTTIYLAKGWTKPSKRLACLLRLDGIFKQAVKQTDYLKKKFFKIQSEKQLAKSPSQKGLLHGSTSSQPDLERENNIIVTKFSKNASIKVDSKMVGCKEEFKTIMKQLDPQSGQQLQVVSIVGMGGIGKTTLARKVYKYPSINSDHFDIRAWVTVSQEYNVEQMLQCLIGYAIAALRDKLHEQSNELNEQRPRNSKENLRKLLSGNRYLIVMDDIWSTTAWDSVQGCFPNDNNGSRILLTSRLGEVAKYVSSGNSTINMPFLDAKKSWNLFCNVFGKTEFLWVFEQIGRDIVNKCEGLPLAIIVVASLLSKTETTVNKWENVAKNVSRYVIGDSNNACSRILYLSYNQLPHHLKACFLYFGVFPEDYEIHVKKLFRLWAAEGFLREVDHQNMEEVALECLQDLVDRSLIFVSKQSYNGKMKAIRIHDLLRDLCLREARHENLLNVIGDVKLPFYKNKISCRWISATPGFDILPLSKCFHKSHSFHSPNFYDDYVSVERLFSHFKLLRVVDIICIFSYGSELLSIVLANLIHLRYLALRFSTNYYSCYDLELFEHWNMQSFILRGAHAIFGSSETSRVWKMPLPLRNSGVCKMPLLRNLCLEHIGSLGTLSVDHRNLESISWLDSRLCTKDLFARIPNLKKLGIDGTCYKNNLDCFYNFVHLKQLEELSIRKWHINLNRIPCSDISWATSFLPNLKKLKFFETNLAWSDMRLIGMLPNLEVLKLKCAIASDDRMWEPSEEGFRQLKRLVIEDRYLKSWYAVGDNFPVLECLELSNCFYLQGIPSGFVDIITLALIQLTRCRDSVLASAKLIQEEQHNNYGNALLVRVKNMYYEETIRVNNKEEELDVEEESDVLVD